VPAKLPEISEGAETRTRRFADLLAGWQGKSLTIIRNSCLTRRLLNSREMQRISRTMADETSCFPAGARIRPLPRGLIASRGRSARKKGRKIPLRSKQTRPPQVPNERMLL